VYATIAIATSFFPRFPCPSGGFFIFLLPHTRTSCCFVFFFFCWSNLSPPSPFNIRKTICSCLLRKGIVFFFPFTGRGRRIPFFLSFSSRHFLFPFPKSSELWQLVFTNDSSSIGKTAKLRFSFSSEWKLSSFGFSLPGKEATPSFPSPHTFSRNSLCLTFFFFFGRKIGLLFLVDQFSPLLARKVDLTAPFPFPSREPRAVALFPLFLYRGIPSLSPQSSHR